MSVRVNAPAEGCKASQDALRADGLKVFEDCPICRETFNVLCQVGCHPTVQQVPTVAPQVGTTYFRLRAVIREGKKYSGWRKRMYQTAQDHHAYYDFQRDLTIGYPEGSNDLVLSLLFKVESDALGFLGVLAFHQTQTIGRGSVEFAEDFEVFQHVQSGRPVLISHYKPADSTSPDDSRADSISVTTNYQDPVFQLRSVHDLSRMVKHEQIFKCHIAPKAHYPQYECDPNNIIYLNSLLHQYFDGDGKKKKPRQGGIPPRIRLDFVGFGTSKVVHGDATYHQINVNIHSYDPEILTSLASLKIRDGYTVLDQNNISTFFYSTNEEQTKVYLELKQSMTTTRWIADGLLTVEDNAAVDELEDEDDE